MPFTIEYLKCRPCELRARGVDADAVGGHVQSPSLGVPGDVLLAVVGSGFFLTGWTRPWLRRVVDQSRLEVEKTRVLLEGAAVPRVRRHIPANLVGEDAEESRALRAQHRHHGKAYS